MGNTVKLCNIYSILTSNKLIASRIILLGYQNIFILAFNFIFELTISDYDNDFEFL